MQRVTSLTLLFARAFHNGVGVATVVLSPLMVRKEVPSSTPWEGQSQSSEE
jgi:hypothetical protein